MVFLCWTRPSKEQQKACINRSGSFNYDPRFIGYSAKPQTPPPPSQEESSSKEENLTRDGFFINRSRVLLGSGPQTFLSAKSALINWRHFGLNWAFVDPETPVEKGRKFCACVNEMVVPWVVLPLQIAYVNSSDSSFGFGSGTLHGHLLAGEERFSVEQDENNQVWYEIYSFSKPAHFLSFMGYPYVRLRQKFFAQQSTSAVLTHIKSQRSIA
ncbi:UPF0548 protein [Acorus calamus]|uniref:UPF0548 protein n=1 Tax=Acorus calamus TaxID=4465 RepID=A0AAV9F9F5_ACOCL|nr:UPF0548 protein [Acorus calamus]